MVFQYALNPYIAHMLLSVDELNYFMQVIQMHCNLESNEEGTRSHVSLTHFKDSLCRIQIPECPSLTPTLCVLECTMAVRCL